MPDKPHIFVACGAALYAAGKPSYVLMELERLVSQASADFGDAAEYLPPLLPEGMTRDEFAQAHKDCCAPRSSFSDLTRDISRWQAELFLDIGRYDAHIVEAEGIEVIREGFAASAN